MSNRTRNLTITTVICFILSLVVYFFEHKRGTDLVFGADFVVGLDVGRVAEVSLKFKDKELKFKRQGEGFVVENFSQYPASNEKINDLFYKVASIQIAEKASSNESNFEKFGVSEKKNKIHVTFLGADEKKVLDFYVGESIVGRGNYVRMADKQDAYISKEGINFSEGKDAFIETKFLSIKKEDIVAIEVNSSKAKLIITQVDKKFSLSGPPADKVDVSKVEEFAKAFTDLSFAEYFTADDSTLNSLKFNDVYRVKVAGDLTYVIQIAKKDKEIYLKIHATFQVGERIALSRDADQKQLGVIEKKLLNRDLSKKYNMVHQRFIYKIAEYKFNQIKKSLSDFMKKPEKK